MNSTFIALSCVVGTVIIGSNLVTGEMSNTFNDKIYNQPLNKNASYYPQTINCTYDKAKQELYSLLDEFASYEKNWNNNDADPFSDVLIQKCKALIGELNVIPEIFPVANNSIQFEFDKENGDFLKFNVFDDHITMFMKLKNGTAISERLNNTDNIIKEVIKFYDG